MKIKSHIIILFTVFLCISITSCNSGPEYPQYELACIRIVPNSLENNYREWVKETVRAASEHMTGGDYEDVDETIKQAEITGSCLFGVEQPCLKIWVSNYESYKVSKRDMNDYQKYVFDSLYNKK